MFMFTTIAGLLSCTEDYNASAQEYKMEVDEPGLFHTIVYFIYRIVSPIIFIIVIGILLWYIVIIIFR